MTTQTVTIERSKLELALDAFIELLQRSENFHTADVHFKDFAVAKDAMESSRAAITAIKEALEQPEQDTCKGCTGNGVVGNILDTDTCPCCKGSGIEAQPEQEPVAYFNPQVKGGFYWAKPTKITAPVTVSVEPMPLYTTPPQRKPLTDEQMLDAFNSCEKVIDGLHAVAELAAHGIKE